MQHAVITGGTGGLGSVIAGVLRDHCWDVASPGSKQLDVRDPENVRTYFRNRQVDLLICSAGITRDALLTKLDEERWDNVMDVNLRGAKRCAEAVIPEMSVRGAGHVIFISSHSAVRPPHGQAAYAASKAALLGLTQEFAAVFGASNIRVNAILPGFLETPMTKNVAMPRKAQVLAEHHLNRFNTAEAVAGFVRFLHEELPDTSGQIFQLDSRSSGLL